MDLTNELRDGARVVRIAGELDTFATQRVREEVDALVTGQASVVDLTEVTFIDSAGLHALFGVGRAARDVGMPIAFVLPAEAGVRRVIELVQLADVVPVCETVETALARVTQDRDAVRFDSI